MTFKLFNPCFNELRIINALMNVFSSITAQNSSLSSSQPEIFTVRETIVTVSAQNSASPSSSVSDRDTMGTPPKETFHSAANRLKDDKGCVDDKLSTGK